MRLPMTLALLVLTLIAMACSTEPDEKPPIACGEISDQEMIGGEEGLVVPCFVDPQNGQVGLTSVTSDANVVTTMVTAAQEVAFTAVKPGEATITVIATNTLNLTAEIDFRVTVFNRPPIAVSTIPDQSTIPGRTTHVDVELYFDDPDGDMLTYAVEAEHPGILIVEVDGSTIGLTGASDGTTQVTVTAMDEYGDMDIQMFSTKVYPVVEQFHEGFEGGYDAGWYLPFGSEAKVSDGVLELWKETIGTSVFERAMVVDLWDIRIRGAQSYDSTWVGVVVGGSDWRDPSRRFILPHVVVGKGDPEFNIGFFIYDSYARSFVSQPSWRAKVPSIESDEFVDFGIRAFDDKYIVSVNGEDVIEVDDSEIYSPTTAFVSLIGYPWVFAESEGFTDAVYFDEFTIAGVSSSTPEGQSRTPHMLWGQLPIEVKWSYFVGQSEGKAKVDSDWF